MENANPLAAEVLETSAAGYASAAHLLMQQSDELGDVFVQASTEWKAHLKQRILELAAAVRVNQPDMFARRVNWLQRAVTARGADAREIRAALESLRTALDRELPEALRHAVRSPIDLALTRLDSDIEIVPRPLDASEPLGRLGLNYVEACLDARTDEATTLVLDAIEAGLSPQQAITEVLVPAQREIGQLWHLGSASVSEERLISETTRDLMALVVKRYAPKPDPARSVLAASVAGNAHDIGLRAVAHLFRLDGWRTLFLGADMPTAEISTAAQTFNVNLIVLCATMTTQIATLGEVIDRIRQIADHPPVLVGGLALENSGELWRELGADAYAPDIVSAVAIASELVGRAH